MQTKKKKKFNLKNISYKKHPKFNVVHTAKYDKHYEYIQLNQTI